jgi:hypothetical protein
VILTATRLAQDRGASRWCSGTWTYHSAAIPAGGCRSGADSRRRWSASGSSAGFGPRRSSWSFGRLGRLRFLWAHRMAVRSVEVLSLPRAVVPSYNHLPGLDPPATLRAGAGVLRPEGRVGMPWAVAHHLQAVLDRSTHDVAHVAQLNDECRPVGREALAADVFLDPLTRSVGQRRSRIDQGVCRDWKGSSGDGKYSGNTSQKSQSFRMFIESSRDLHAAFLFRACKFRGRPMVVGSLRRRSLYVCPHDTRQSVGGEIPHRAGPAAARLAPRLVRRPASHPRTTFSGIPRTMVGISDAPGWARRSAVGGDGLRHLHAYVGLSGSR